MGPEMILPALTVHPRLAAVAPPPVVVHPAQKKRWSKKSRKRASLHRNRITNAPMKRCRYLRLLKVLLKDLSLLNTAVRSTSRVLMKSESRRKKPSEVLAREVEALMRNLSRNIQDSD